MSTLKLKVPGMACDACGQTITDAIQAIDSQASVQTDTKTKQVIVESEASELSIREAIAAAGYPCA